MYMHAYIYRYKYTADESVAHTSFSALCVYIISYLCVEVFLYCAC